MITTSHYNKIVVVTTEFSNCGSWHEFNLTWSPGFIEETFCW